MTGSNVDEMQKATLIKRSKRVAFMNVGTSEEPSYVRMQGFTSMSESKSPTEYSRQYMDEDTERTDVVGYATQIAYSFDRHSPFSVHEKLAQISDDELTGSDAHVDIVTVDLFSDGSQKEARKRTYAVIPDTTGDGTDALIYSGNFRAVGEAVKGVASSSDKWQTVTFADSTQEIGTLTVSTAAGTGSCNTKVTVSPELTEGNKYKYANADGLEQPAYDEDVSVLTDWDGEADIKMATGETIMIVECTQDNKARKAGTGEVTAAV